MTGQSYQVETVKEEDDDDEFEGYRSPMDSPPLRDEPDQPMDAMWNDPEDRPDPPNSANKPGREEHNNIPLDFSSDPLETELPTVKGLTPEELIGRSILMPPGEDGSRNRATIIQLIDDMKNNARDHPELIKFKCRVNGKREEIVAYNDVVDYIEQDDGWDGVWKFRRILDHQGPLRPNDKRYKGSKYNVLIEWEDGSQTWEPLWKREEGTNRPCGIGNLDPVTVAIYAKKHNLLAPTLRIQR